MKKLGRGGEDTRSIIECCKSFHSPWPSAPPKKPPMKKIGLEDFPRESSPSSSCQRLPRFETVLSGNISKQIAKGVFPSTKQKLGKPPLISHHPVVRNPRKEVDIKERKSRGRKTLPREQAEEEHRREHRSSKQSRDRRDVHPTRFE